MEQQGGQVVAIRPAELEVGVPGFVPSVKSTAANIYIQSIDAQTHDERRMAFQWRSPSSGLVLSPLAYLIFRLKISAPYKLNRTDMIGPLCGTFDCEDAEADANIGADPVPIGATIRTGYGMRPLLCFGEGNCVQNAMESISIGINGAVWTQLSGDLYNRTLERCFCPDAITQRVFSTCGGRPRQFDDNVVSGHVLGISNLVAQAARDVGGVGANNAPLCVVEAAAGQARTSGFRPIEARTADSGVVRRMENLYDQIVAEEAATAAGQTITIEIRAGIQGGPFKSLFGASGLSRQDPRLKMCLGIPNYNTGSFVFNFKNLRKQIVRRLGRPGHLAAASAMAGNVSAFIANDITVAYDSTYTPKIQLTYIRLPSFSQYPTSSAITVYRRDVRKPVKQVTGTKTFDRGLFDGSVDLTGLQCCDSSLQQATGSLTMRPPAFADVKAKCEAEVNFTGVQFPQIPDQLLIVFEKSSDVYNLNNPAYGVDFVAPQIAAAAGRQAKWGPLARPGGARGLFDTHANTEAALMGKVVAHNVVQAAASQATFDQELVGRYIAQNQDSNCSLMQLSITVQSAVGSWAFRGEAENYLEDRDLLWRKHSKNCCDAYLPAGRGRWQQYASAAFLSINDFLLGLQVSSGVVFPVIFDVKCRYRNTSAVCSGLNYTTGQSKGVQVYDDFMVGTPVLVGCFNSQILSIASSSAVISAQAFSASTAAAALAQNG